MTGCTNRILLLGCETTRPLDAILPSRPGVGDGAPLFFLDFFFAGDSVKGSVEPSSVAAVSPEGESRSTSSGGSKDLTQARALRGSKTGWAVRVTCMAS